MKYRKMDIGKVKPGDILVYYSFGKRNYYILKKIYKDNQDLCDICTIGGDTLHCILLEIFKEYKKGCIKVI